MKTTKQNNWVLVSFLLGASVTLFTPNMTAQPVQWPMSDGGNGHWYEGVAAPAGINWTDARDAAISKGGYLACITSPAENTFVFNLTAGLWAGGPDPYTNLIGPWLGGYQDFSAQDYSEPAGGWRWISGEPWVNPFWAPGQPDNAWGGEQYLDYFASNSPTPSPTWNDCTDSDGIRPVVGYMVEYDTIPEPSTFVLLFLGLPLLARRIKMV